MKLSQNAIAGRGTSFRTYRCLCTRRFAGCTSPDPRSKLFKFLKLLSYRQSFPEWRYATSRQERSLSTGGAKVRYPMESHFTLLAQNTALMVDTWEVKAPVRVYRRFGDLFGTNSMTRSGMTLKTICIVLLLLACALPPCRAVPGKRPMRERSNF